STCSATTSRSARQATSGRPFTGANPARPPDRCSVHGVERAQPRPVIGVWRRHWAAPAAALIPVALAAYVQFPATRSCFRADDYVNLYQINNYSLFQYLIIPNAGHLLVARNAVFYLCWLLFGPAQAPYLWLAYLTHLLNVWFVFRRIEVFTNSRAAALLGAALWGACPLHAAIGYYAVYGHVMVGTIVLVILLQSGRAAGAGAPPPPLRTAVWYGLAITA